MRTWILGALALLALGTTVLSCGGDRSPNTAANSRPNIVFILTDDQTHESLRVMTRTKALLADEGTTFSNAIISYPLCCPSRATLLTGQYAHNHGVLENVPPQGGVEALDATETLAVWLERAGYATSHIGKYLNGYGDVSPPTVPPGWTEWFGLQDPSTYGYLAYDVSINGTLQNFQGEANYQTDVLTDRAVAEVERLGADGDTPFFLNVWYTAPHGGRDLAVPSRGAPVVAPRHRGTAADEVLPPNPALNEPDVSDKPARIEALPELPLSDAQQALRTYQATLEALQAVDEGVGRIVDRLDAVGALDDTVIVFMSDNGLMFGEHRLLYQKTVPYEESIHVPMIIRGGGFPAGAEVSEPVSNIDFAPTMLDLAGADAGLEVDGRSLLPLAEDPSSTADRPILIENGPGNRIVDHYEGVRTRRYTYVEYSTGERELYDLVTDPIQADNLAGRPDMAEVEAQLAQLVTQLQRCSGAACQVEAPTFRDPAEG